MARRVPGVSDVRAEEMPDGRVLLKFHDGAWKDPFAASHVSDGTIKMFAYLVLLNSPMRHSLLCVEEPENQLYPSLLNRLLEEFRLYAGKGGGQVFVSTHSPDLLNAAKLDEVFWLEKKTRNRRRASRFRKQDNRGNGGRRRCFGPHLAHGIIPRGESAVNRLVFLVEGEADEAFLRAFLPLAGVPEDHFHIYPQGGKPALVSNFYRLLREWRGPAVRFVILVDQDIDDCKQLKREIKAVARKECAKQFKDLLVRIACREAESWYFGRYCRPARGLS